MDTEYITPFENASSAEPRRTHVTVTHPHHPLAGLTVEVVRGTRNPGSPIVVRTSDGSNLTIPKEWTDYYDSPDQVLADTAHLCSLEGLKQLARILEATASSENPPNIVAANNKRKGRRRVKTR